MTKTKTAFEFDYESVKNKALAQLKSGKPLLGKEGALAPLFKSFSCLVQWGYPSYRCTATSTIFIQSTAPIFGHTIMAIAN
jgi:hypothetical protein